MSACCQPEHPELASELRIAQRALDLEHDLTHCRHHLLNALSMGPNDVQVGHLLHAWVSEARAEPTLWASSLEPKDADVREGMLAARLQQLNGDASTAAAWVLATLSGEAPIEVCFWLHEWARDPQWCKKLEPVRIAHWLSAICNADRPDAAALYGALDDWLDVVDRYLVWEGELRVFRLRIKRRAGRGDAALAMAGRWERESPDFWSVLLLGGCHLELDDVEAALAAYQLAAERAPENGRVWVDIGDCHKHLGDLAEAIRAYQIALDLGGPASWALPALHACAYVRAPTPAHWSAFVESLSTQEVPEHRIRELRAFARSWTGHIPGSNEATLNAVIKVLEEGGGKAGVVRSACTAIEAPSARFLAWRLLAAHNQILRMSFTEIAHPDVRLGGSRLSAWTCTGTHAWPRFRRPAADLLDHISRFAEEEFEATTWLCSARQLQLETPMPSMELVAAVPWSDLKPRHWHPIYWCRRHVFACVFLVAGQADRALAQTDLWDLVLAPMDWAGEAALVALGTLALEDRAVLPVLIARAVALDSRVPDQASHYALARGLQGLERLLAEHEVELPAPHWWREPD